MFCCKIQNNEQCVLCNNMSLYCSHASNAIQDIWFTSSNPPPPPQLTFTEACASKSPFVNIPLSITENGKVYSYTLAYGFLTRLILIYLKFQREFESVGPLGQGVGNVPRQNHDNPRINIPPLSKRHYTGKLRQENLFLTYYDPLMIFPECTDLDGQI